MSTHIDPERDQFEAFKALPRDEPVMMLNLLRFRDKAAYPDGRDVTGAEAYAAYGRDSAPVFQRVGGEIVWRGRPEVTLIGPRDEQWDLAFVARYPTAADLAELPIAELEKIMDCGEFIRDLHDRICFAEITIPPLRKRREDIPLLVSHLVSKLGTSMRKSVKSVARSSMDALVTYDWPGNVRQLDDALACSVGSAQSGCRWRRNCNQ